MLEVSQEELEWRFPLATLALCLFMYSHGGKIMRSLVIMQTAAALAEALTRLAATAKPASARCALASPDATVRRAAAQAVATLASGRLRGSLPLSYTLSQNHT